MRQYKDSGIEWIGKIPETWEVCKLNYIYRFQTGATPPSKVEQYFDGDIKWANISDLKSQYVYDTNKHLSEAGVAKCNMNISPKGSLMYSFKLSVGAVAFCGCDMYTNEAIATFLQGFGNLHYLYYMSQVAIINNANYNIYGAPILNQDLIQNALVINPPLIDQQRIADYLDTKCGEIDSLIGLQEQMIEKLKAYKQSVITEAVTKGLDPNVKFVPSGIDWIGEIPEGWKITKFKYFGTIRSGNGLSNESLKSEGLYPVWGGNGLMGYYSEYNQSKPALIIGRVGALCGNVRMLQSPTFITDNALIYELYNNVSHKFLYWASVAADFNKLNTSNAQPLVTGTKIRNYPFALPPLSEQQAIAAYLDEKCADIDRLISLKQQKIEALKDYKKSVIYEAVTGKTEI